MAEAKRRKKTPVQDTAVEQVVEQVVEQEDVLPVEEKQTLDTVAKAEEIVFSTIWYKEDGRVIKKRCTIEEHDALLKKLDIVNDGVSIRIHGNK